MKQVQVDRRNVMKTLGGAALATCVASSGVRAGAANVSRNRRMDLSNPADALIATMKCNGTLEDGVEVIRWMEGIVYSLFDDGEKMDALHGVVGVFPSRSWRQTDGTYKVVSNDVIFYTDLKSGKVIEQFKNPYTDQLCEVHNHASVLNTIVGPSAPRESEMLSLQREWVVRMGIAAENTESRIKKLNPIDPIKWPLESSGKWYLKKSSNQMFAKLADLENTDMPSVPTLISSQRFGPWYPWMLMGSKPGRNFSHMTVYKAQKMSDVPRNILEYAEKNKPQFLTAPKTWTGEYVDPETLYTRERKPASPAAK